MGIVPVAVGIVPAGLGTVPVDTAVVRHSLEVAHYRLGELLRVPLKQKVK